jgi:hypothetical protein
MKAKQGNEGTTVAAAAATVCVSVGVFVRLHVWAWLWVRGWAGLFSRWELWECWDPCSCTGRQTDQEHVANCLFVVCLWFTKIQAKIVMTGQVLTDSLTDCVSGCPALALCLRLVVLPTTQAKIVMMGQVLGPAAVAPLLTRLPVILTLGGPRFKEVRGCVTVVT